MCNCNQKRASISNNPPKRGSIQVKYVGDEPFSMNGDVTGREYAFSKQNLILRMDRRDAKYLDEYANLITLI